eukprot:RCo034055
MSMDALLSALAAAVQQQQHQHLGDEGYPIQDYEPAKGYTFVDCMRSIDCDQTDTTAVCKESRSATLLTKQVFTCPGRAEFCVRLERLPSREHQICIGVAGAGTSKNVGNHNALGDRTFPNSLGYACRVGASAIFHEGNCVGGGGTGWSPGTTLGVRVTPEGLSFLRNGQAVGSSFTLKGRFRFAVSLCGEGQVVRICKAQASSSEHLLIDLLHGLAATEGDEGYPIQDYEPAKGYTFVDCMRSIDCDQTDTVAVCKESRDATLLTRQVFTC